MKCLTLILLSTTLGFNAVSEATIERKITQEKIPRMIATPDGMINIDEVIRDAYRRTAKVVGDSLGNEKGYDERGSITYELIDTNGDKTPDKAVYPLK